MNLSSILIGSENPARLVEYYTRLFGEPMMSEGGYTAWQLGNGGVVVGPHDQVHGQNAEPGRIIWNLDTPDVKAEFERLKAAGATVVRDPYAPGMGDDILIATFADPDGNYFQLQTPMQM